MKTRYRFFTTILTLVLMTTTLVLPQIEATTSPWAVGARTLPLLSNVSEMSGFVGVPSLPATNAQGGTTLLFTAGWTQSNRFLNQPEIRAFSSGWTGVLEVWDSTTGLDAEPSYTTNVVMSTGHTARFDLYLSSNQSCQTIKDATNNAIATKCFSANNYGTSYTENWTELEAYDTVSSDFSAMDGTISFTSVQQYVNGVGSPISMTGSTYNSPPCTSASGGSGSLSITLTNC